MQPWLTSTRVLFPLMGLLLLAGCSAPTSDNAAQQMNTPSMAIHHGPPPNVAEGPYRIGVGDELAIKFFFSPELNETMQVRPDGKISLQFIQDVTAVGYTPEDLGKMLRQKLKRSLRQPDLVVVVRNAASHRVFIGGEVAKAGSVPLIGHQTLLQALNEAGWVTPAADRSEIVLVRTDVQGKQSVYALNLDKIISGEDMSQNATLAAGDVIMVPPSNITSFDRWVDQYIRMATPIPGNFVITNQNGNR